MMDANESGRARSNSSKAGSPDRVAIVMMHITIAPNAIQFCTVGGFAGGCRA